MLRMLLMSAEETVLAMCRKTGLGRWVMRKLPEGGVGVVDLSRSERVPRGFDWERRDKRVATGDTWEAVLDALEKLPLPS